MKTRVFTALIFCALGFGLFACTVLSDIAFKDDVTTTTSTTTTTIGLTVEAGDAQIVHSGTVTLNGSANDPNSNDMTFEWTQKSGNPAAVTINDWDSTNASFNVPSVVGDYNFTFFVTAGEELKSDSVTISVTNAAPTADAGTNEWAITTGDAVSFTGSATDPEDDGLTYAWTQKSGNPSVLTLTGENTDTVSFAQTDTVGVYTLILTVTDSYGASVSDEVSVSVLEKKIIASDGPGSDFFGWSQSVSGDGKTIIVGAYLDIESGIRGGSVFIYKWDGSSWVETKLTASDIKADDRFGYSVGISADGESAIVGSCWDDDYGSYSGSAYIYKWDGTDWNETKLNASDGAENDFFGSFVSISANGLTAIVGAYGDDDYGETSGSAYIYKWDGSSWVETKLRPGDVGAYDDFGKSVSISEDGETAIVGAYYDDDNGSNSGAAYIYKWDGTDWIETKLTADDNEANDWFGYSVSISEDGLTAIVGAHGEDDNEDGSGAAYVYKWNGTSWVETKILASDGAYSDSFGYSVLISGDGETIIVGARFDDNNETDSGSAYIYQWDGTDWVETKLTASDGAASDWFGYSVSISDDGSVAVVGAYKDDDNGSDSGSAYIYSVDALTSMP